MVGQDLWPWAGEQNYGVFHLFIYFFNKLTLIDLEGLGGGADWESRIMNADEVLYFFILGGMYDILLKEIFT